MTMARTLVPRPIRVLIVDTAIAFGGTLAVARNLLKHLDPSVVEASLVSACSDGFVSRGFAGNAEVRLLAPAVDYVTLAKWKRTLQRRFSSAPLRRGLQLLAMSAEILANTAYLARLVHLYRSERVDVVHVNNYTMAPLWAARLLGIPIVYHLHGFVSHPLDGSGRRNFRHVKAFVSISQAVTDAAVRAGIDPARIHTIPNFVEQAPAEDPPPLPSEPAIGIFGRVTQWKGQKEFLRAAIEVLPRFPRLRIYVVGDSSDADPRYLDECQQIARSSPFAARIEFVGLVHDVASYYVRCTAVVHASIEPEPFGMVLIEAMANARPVIASILGAAPEIVEEGADGYLVDPTDIASMADRISRLLGDLDLATRMGMRGHEKVRTQYDPRAAAGRFQRLYAEIAASRAHSDRSRAKSAPAPP